jgi:hypothetical protein
MRKISNKLITMKTCDTCKYFNDNGVGNICRCPKMLYGYYGRLPIEDEIMIEDDEGWGIHPGPKFGCIHHEENHD